MTRLLLCTALLLAVAACSSGSANSGATVPTSPAGSPGSTDRTSPEAAVKTLYEQMARGDCDRILESYTEGAVARIRAKVPDQGALCEGYRRASRDIVEGSTLQTVKQKSAEATKATVTVSVRDRRGKVDTTDLTLLRESESWKVDTVNF